MRRSRLMPSVLAITLATAGGAAAHVAPSVDDNNRYLKLTPGADRIRIAYTVFYGQVPGAGLRPSLDQDRDGGISESEGQAFGKRLAAEVAKSLELTVDGRAQPIVWASVAVGLGTTETAAGAFSVDLVTSVCLGTARGRHSLLLRDRFRLENPGETEVRVEDSPGVTIQRARIGRIEDPSHAYQFVGPGGPLLEDGFDVAFVAGNNAPLTGDGACPAAARPDPGRPTAYIIGAAAVLGFVLAGVVAVVQRRRRRIS